MTPCKDDTMDSGMPRLFVDPALLKTMIEVAVKRTLDEEVARHLGGKDAGAPSFAFSERPFPLCPREGGPESVPRLFALQGMRPHAMISKETYQHRIKKVRKALRANEREALVVIDRINTRYLTGFSGSYSYLIITQDDAHFITDSRYGEVAAALLEDVAQLHVQPLTDVQEWFRKLFKKEGFGTVGHEGTITVNELEYLKGIFRKAKLSNEGPLITQLRRTKDEEELKSIRKAVRLADRVMGEALDRVKVGMTEAELSRTIRILIEEFGGERESFSNIVASGPNSSRPHHQPTNRRFRKGDPVTIDLGGVVAGYCSDLTRTPVLGKPSEQFEQIYAVALEAQQAAIAALKPGMNGREVDAIARGVIAEAGFGNYFGHGLGHGVGLEIHEDPRLSPRAGDYELEPGNIVTIEPGIYLPGECGVRIEDYVLVTEDGCEVLSKTPRRLKVIG
jgi:Xaa-Pro aminopeptidase